MDSSGHLREIYEEDLITMTDLTHPVDSKADLPDFKRILFEEIHKAGNRKARKKLCKHLKADWHEYQIFKRLI